MAVALTNTIPWRISQVIQTVFNKNNRLWELEQRAAQLEQYQSMQHSITQVIARSTELEVAIPRILQTICETIGWEFGEVWHSDPETSCLYCDASWHVPSLKFPTFGKSGLDITFRPGKGLPGQVWAIGKPTWISDVVVDTNFMRASLAERDGLHAGFGIPIRTEGAIIGVMTFFSRRILDVDRNLLRVLDTIGSQIGLFIERKRLEEVEQAQARQLAAMQERQRLARDLHDSVTQTLFSANVIAEMLPQWWERKSDQMRPGLDELQSLTRSALAEMRSLLVELRPVVSERASLTQTLDHLVHSVAERTNLQASLEVNDRGGLESDTQIALYRITQEAVNNIVKHAQADHVWIGLCAENGHFDLKIRDDGRGFKTDCLPTDHFGVGIMRERAEEIGAHFDLKSVPGKGTSLIISR